MEKPNDIVVEMKMIKSGKEKFKGWERSSFRDMNWSERSWGMKLGWGVETCKKVIKEAFQIKLHFKLNKITKLPQITRWKPSVNIE